MDDPRKEFPKLETETFSFLKTQIIQAMIDEMNAKTNSISEEYKISNYEFISLSLNVIHGLTLHLLNYIANLYIDPKEAYTNVSTDFLANLELAVCAQKQFLANTNTNTNTNKKVH